MPPRIPFWPYLVYYVDLDIVCYRRRRRDRRSAARPPRARRAAAARTAPRDVAEPSATRLPRGAAPAAFPVQFARRGLRARVRRARDGEPRAAAVDRDLPHRARPQDRRSHAGRRDRRHRAVSRHPAHSLCRLAHDRLSRRRRRRGLPAAALRSAAADRERDSPWPERANVGRHDRHHRDGIGQRADRPRLGQRRWPRSAHLLRRDAASDWRTCAIDWRFCTATTGIISGCRTATRPAAPSPSSRFPFANAAIPPAPRSATRARSCRSAIRHLVALRRAVARCGARGSRFRQCGSSWGLVWTQQSWLYDTLRHRLGDRTWLSIAKNDMMSALVWTVFTPIVLALAARRFPIRQARVAARRVPDTSSPAIGRRDHARHVGATADQSRRPFVFARLAADVSSSTASSSSCSRRSATAACCSTGCARARPLSASLTRRSRGRPGARREAAVDSAGSSALARRHRRAPSAAIPSLTERQLTRLGDYLRLALECTDERGDHTRARTRARLRRRGAAGQRRLHLGVTLIA